MNFTGEKVEIEYKGKKYTGLKTDNPNLVYIVNLGKMIDLRSVGEEKPEEDDSAEKRNNEFLSKNGLDPYKWEHVLVYPSGENQKYFYFHLHGLRNKCYIDGEKEEEIVEWMKLTEKLFM